MIRSLDEKKKRFIELQALVSDPGVIADHKQYQKYARELARLKPIVEEYDEYMKLAKEIAELELVLEEEGHDEGYVRLAREERELLSGKREASEKKLEGLIFEKDADADRDVIMEIRAGTGGLEAGLFAADLFRMYTRYAVKKGWKAEMIDVGVSEKGGYKEAIFSISGQDVFGTLKYESGTHRVQRVPETEASGRIHTSAATVAVLPEAEEVDVKIDPAELKIDVFRASGAGGQHVNKTDSAVRITHLPSGMVVVCQDERSQFKNKSKALRVLRARLMDHIRTEQEKKISADRKAQVGSGDRSEKIRTYNFPDRRVTDHRIGLTVHNLEKILEGELDEIIGALKEADRKARLAHA